MNKILFICLGNICRSPSAEGVFKNLVKQKGLADIFEIDSAGTCSHHIGELPDPRMREHAKKRNLILDSRARQFDETKDFEYFDYLVVMDDSNFDNIQKLDPEKKYSKKIVKMTSFGNNLGHNEVPDPYYGGPEGFETVLDILENTCSGLLKELGH